MNTFVDELITTIEKKQTILCGGDDPQVRYIPEEILQQGWEEAKDKSGFEPMARAFVIFNKAVIKAMVPYIAVIKPNRAFYEAYGSWGIWALEETIKFAREQGLLVLIDAKCADGSDTAMMDAKGWIGKVDKWTPDDGITQEPSYDVDAVTMVGYIADSAVDPFVKEVKESMREHIERELRSGKGVFIVDKTSFKPNSRVEQLETKSGLKVWQEVALLVKEWREGTEGTNGYFNVGVVMGATFEEDAPFMRETLPKCFFLAPGYSLPGGLGQGGGADGAIAGIDENGLGVIANISRGGTFAYIKGMFQCEPGNYLDATEKAVKFGRDDLNNAIVRRLGKLPW